MRTGAEKIADKKLMDGLAGMAARRPLGGRAYGSIPHLPGSRQGPADIGIHPGQAAIATEKARDKHDRIIVQEKLDGSCCAIAKVEAPRLGDSSSIQALTRAGYRAHTSPFEQHHKFSAWVNLAEVYNRAHLILDVGERLVGEWLIQAHGTRYDLPHWPFVVFDIMRGNTRVPYDEMVDRVGNLFPMPRLIHAGGPLSIENAMAAIERSGHGALDPVEGAVWRVERNGKVDFLCKYVRQDKADGLYLPEISGGIAVWNRYPGDNYEK